MTTPGGKTSSSAVIDCRRSFGTESCTVVVAPVWTYVGVGKA